MLTLFNSFSSKRPRMRKSEFLNQDSPNGTQGLWVKVMPKTLTREQRKQRMPMEKEQFWQLISDPEHRKILQGKIQQAPSATTSITFDSRRGWEAVYCAGPWLSTIAKNMKITKVGTASYLIRSPERKIGLADAQRRSARIKNFGLAEALVQSYLKDLRFVFICCCLIGFSIWYAHVTEQLFINPRALTSPDLELLVRVSKETFVDHICSDHHVPSPCPCGEPLNNAARHLLENKEHFDPLGIYNQNARVKAVTVYLAAILLGLALTESVSQYGILV